MEENYELVGSSKCKEVLAAHPDYKVFWRAGFGWKGAAEAEDDKQPKVEYLYWDGRSRETSFEERMQRRYNWAAAIDITVNNDKKEIHFNGFSANDLY